MKPSRWGNEAVVNRSHRAMLNGGGLRYYRRLCAHYIGEALRLRRERDEAEAIVLNISGDPDPAAWFSRCALDDTEDAE